MTAAAVGSGGLDVLSTPWMIAMMESASRDAVQKHLPEGFTTVGTRVDVRHTAPVYVGTEVTVESAVVEISGRILRFRVAVRCGDREVGSGFHERAVVNMEKFMSRSGKGV
jgi:predicted thioesterase